MVWTQRDYLIAYTIAVAIAVLLIFTVRRGPRQPFRLNLSDSGEPPQSPQPPQSPVAPPVAPSTAPSAALATQSSKAAPRMNSGPRAGAQASQSSQARLVVEKSLNAVFNWNGHSWDAYEILGVPAGSSAEAVDQAFREACTKADAESLPFLEAARAAIQRS